MLWGADSVPAFRAENEEPWHVTANEQGLCLSECNYPDLWPWGSWGSDKKPLGRVLLSGWEHAQRWAAALISVSPLFLPAFFSSLLLQKKLWEFFFCLLSFLGEENHSHILFVTEPWIFLGSSVMPRGQLWCPSATCGGSALTKCSGSALLVAVAISSAAPASSDGLPVLRGLSTQSTNSTEGKTEILASPWARGSSHSAERKVFNGLAQTGVNAKNQIKHLHSRPWDPNCPVTAQLLHRHLQLHPLLLHHSTFQYSLPSQGTLSVSPTGKNCLMQSRGSVCAWQVVWYLENKMFVVKEHCPWYNHLKGIILGCLWSGPKLWLLSMN